MINYFIFVKYNDGLDLIPGKCKHYLIKPHPHLSRSIRYFSLVTCSNILAKMLPSRIFLLYLSNLKKPIQVMSHNHDIFSSLKMRLIKSNAFFQWKTFIFATKKSLTLQRLFSGNKHLMYLSTWRPSRLLTSVDSNNRTRG